MLKKCSSMLLVVSLTLTLCSVNAFGRSNNTPERKAATETPADAARRSERLRTNVRKLVADTRAEANGVTIRPQSQMPHSNNLSTGKKVAIGVAVGVAVLVVVGIVVARHSGPRGSIAIFGN